MKYVRTKNTGHEVVTCPHCGSMNLYIESIPFRYGHRFYVCCESCGATGPAMMSVTGETGSGPDMAAKAWNGFIPERTLKKLTGGAV